MSKSSILKKSNAELLEVIPGSPGRESLLRDPVSLESGTPSRALFRTVWYAGNLLLILAILLTALFGRLGVLDSEVFERIFRRDCSRLGADRRKSGGSIALDRRRPDAPSARPDPSSPDRDPTDTLNYTSLLRVCGNATNAFINLSDSAGLAARRLCCWIRMAGPARGCGTLDRRTFDRGQPDLSIDFSRAGRRPAYARAIDESGCVFRGDAEYQRV